ncbi:MAG: hypothetical protein WDW38_009630 [Sanguina aurantia]
MQSSPGEDCSASRSSSDSDTWSSVSPSGSLSSSRPSLDDGAGCCAPSGNYGSRRALDLSQEYPSHHRYFIQ